MLRGEWLHGKGRGGGWGCGLGDVMVGEMDGVELEFLFIWGVEGSMWRILFLVFGVGLDLELNNWLYFAALHSLKLSIEKDIPFLSFLMDLVEKTFLLLGQPAFHLFLLLFFSLKLLLYFLEIGWRGDAPWLALFWFLFLHYFLRGWRIWINKYKGKEVCLW